MKNNTPKILGGGLKNIKLPKTKRDFAEIIVPTLIGSLYAMGILHFNEKIVRPVINTANAPAEILSSQGGKPLVFVAESNQIRELGAVTRRTLGQDFNPPINVKLADLKKSTNPKANDDGFVTDKTGSVIYKMVKPSTSERQS